jgi:hypothetical protein
MFTLGLILYLLLIIVLASMLRSYNPTWITYGRSLGEFAVVYFVGNIPFLFILIDGSLSAKAITLREFLAEEGRPGEILIYVSAFLAPVIFTFLSWYKSANPTWHTTHFLLILACLMLSLYLFVKYRNLNFFENTKIDQVSLFLYLCSLTLWFFSIVYYRALNEKNFSHKGKNRILTRMQQEGY